MPAPLFLEKGVKSMTKIKKRATALLLGTVTFFMALYMPFNTTRVYAADVAFSWVVNESSNTILNWILLYLGISVAPEAISEGKVFDKTGQFALDFCNDFFGDTFEQWYVSNGFGDDVDTFKKAFNDILTQDYDAAKYVAGDVKSSVLNIINSYLYDSNVYNNANLNYKYSDLLVSENNSMSITGSIRAVGKDSFSKSGTYNFTVTSGHCIPVATICELSSGHWSWSYNLVSDSKFYYKLNGSLYQSTENNNPVSFGGSVFYTAQLAYGLFSGTFDNIFLNINCPFRICNNDLFSSRFHDYPSLVSYDIFNWLYSAFLSTPIDLPDIAGKDWAYDLVGWPNAWDVDKPDVKPWDDVDSLPIPGDIAIPKEIPGVTDLPGILDGVVGGTIPWPDIIDIIKDLPVDPTPDPDKPTKPDPDPELPEIPAVLPQGVSDKLKDLSGKFPFCIPFDLVDCFKSFGSNEAAEAPKWDLIFRIPGTAKDYEFSVDLSMFDKYIPIFRSGVLILFLIGLMLGTRKLIGWQVKN